MRYVTFFALLFLITACSLTKSGKQTASASEVVPPGLEAPAYDPSTSPEPMTASTPLPLPPSAEVPAGQAPTRYGEIVTKGAAYGPETYGTQRGALAPAPTTYAQTVLSGDWVNMDDEREVVQFTPTHYKTYFEGELLVEEDMTYHALCPAACSGGESLGIPCFTISGPALTDCYGIVRLTEEVMELSLLGVSTETIVYRKLN